MWIKTQDLKDLLEYARYAKAPNNYIEAWQYDIEYAEKREKERKEKKIRDKMALCDLIYTELQKAATPLCPTDIQFLIFRSVGKEYSCSKIVRGLVTMEDFDSIIVSSGLDNLQYLKGRYKKIEGRISTDTKDRHVYWKIK